MHATPRQNSTKLCSVTASTEMRPPMTAASDPMVKPARLPCRRMNADAG